MEDNTQHSLRQEAFNKVWNYFVVEKHGPSAEILSNGAVRCQYRGENGCRCAVGFLLPDAEYVPDMENLIPFASKWDNGNYIDPWKNVISLRPLGEGFLEDLQSCHDDVAGFEGEEQRLCTPEEFNPLIKEALESFANNYDLTIPGETN